MKAARVEHALCVSVDIPDFPNVLKLTVRDINGIRNLIANEQKNRGMDECAQKVAEKLKDVLKVDSELQGYDFLRQLLRDYNYLTSRD